MIGAIGQAEPNPKIRTDLDNELEGIYLSPYQHHAARYSTS